MLNLFEANQRVKDVLQRNLTITAERVKENMAGNYQIVTGRTANSLRVEVTAVEGILWGAEHIDTLEVGISPERSRLNSWKVTFLGLSRWYLAKGLTTGFYPDRRIVAATHTQRMMGSVMYRTGAFKNVYSGEVTPLIQRIMNEASNIIMNVKILE